MKNRRRDFLKMISLTGLGLAGGGLKKSYAAQRGPSHLRQLIHIEGVEIKALCDLRPEKAEDAKKMLKNTDHNPGLYSGSEDECKKLCQHKDIDLVIINTKHGPAKVFWRGCSWRLCL